MRKKNILRLLLLTACMALLWSCRSEDFAKAEADPQRNNADFFKHSSSILAKSGTDYITILEDYSKETDFLSRMPDQKGMPIWDKMYSIETENTSGLMIPLSYDSETMSSILFVTLDGKNTVTGVKDYDNTILRNVVYNQNFSVENREQFFLNFIFMDNRTFGNERFTGIPKDLFVGEKFNNEYGMMLLKNFTTSSEVTTQQAGKLFIGQVCFVAHHCTHHGGAIGCDGCGECQTTTCTISVMGTADDPFPTTPGGGGGGPGGGGGCFDCGGDNPPTGPNVPTPCVSSGSTGPFYRLGLGQNCGNWPEIPDDPCEKASLPVSQANDILHAPTIATEKATLEQHAANSFTEYGMAIVSTGTSIIAQDPYSNNNPQDPGTVSISIPSLGDYLGDAHTHPRLPPPSVRDLYGTFSHTRDYPTFQVNFIFTKDGTKYAFVVTDRDKAIAFLSAYPALDNTEDEGRMFNKEHLVGIEFNDIYNSYRSGISPSYSGNDQIDGLESAYAYVLDKFDTGISIAKTDANGNLKALKAVSFKYTVPASGGKKVTIFKAQPCP